MAPQTLLLAVCPDGRENWDEDLLASVVYETLDFVKQRSHDYATYSQFQYIPESIPLSIGISRLGSSFQRCTSPSTRAATQSRPSS